MNRSVKMLDYAAMAVILLNLTNAYTLLSALTGVSFKVAGIAMIAVLGLNVFSNSEILRSVLKRTEYLWFLVIFCLLPAFSTLMTPSYSIRYIGYIVLSSLIFVNCAILMIKMGWQDFSRYILLSWFIGVCFIVISYFLPGMFEKIAFMQYLASPEAGDWGTVKVAQADNGRAFGLYMQSNRACLAMGLHLLMLLPVYFHQRHSARMIILGITLFAILLTGSRGGFVYIVVISLLLMFFEMCNGVKVDGRVKSGATIFPKYLFLLLILVIALTAAEFYSRTNIAGVSPVERVLGSFFNKGTDLGDDSSVSGRLYAQELYFQKIKQSPILGHGLGASDLGRAKGTLEIASHNNFLETAYSYGVPMAVITYGLFFYLLRSKQSLQRRSDFRYDISWMLVIFMLLSSFATNSLFDYRMFPVVMAFWMGMLYFPYSSYSKTHK